MTIVVYGVKGQWFRTLWATVDNHSHTLTAHNITIIHILGGLENIKNKTYTDNDCDLCSD